MADDTKPVVPAGLSPEAAQTIADLKAELQRLKDDRKASEAEAKKKAEAAAAEALRLATEKAATAEKTLADERAARATADRNRAVWDALQGGTIKDVDGEVGKPIRANAGVYANVAEFAKDHDLEGVALGEGGTLPADFTAKVREWAKARPGRFQVGEPAAGVAPIAPSVATGGGAIGSGGTLTPQQRTEAEGARAMAQATWQSLGVLPPPGAAVK